MIRGSGVEFRPMEPGDIDAFLGWVNSRDVAPYWYGKDRRLTREELLGDWNMHYFDGSAPEKGRCFIVQADSHPVGMASYTDVTDDIDGRARRADIDMFIAGPYQGRGYGTDALISLLSYLIGELGYHRIEAGTYGFNWRMRRCLSRAGFKFEGIFRKSDWVDGRFVDVARFAILAEEFDPPAR